MLLGFIAFLNVFVDYEDTYVKSTLFATSTDTQRRICGEALQKDTRAADYSNIITDKVKMLSFCKLMNAIHIDNPSFLTFNCDDKLKEYTNAELLPFLTELNHQYNDMTEY